MTKTELIEALKDYKLSHHWKAIEDISIPCVGFHLSSEADEDIPIGSSKLGGKPDLPIGHEWLMEQTLSGRDKKPLSFVAQINLAEISPLDIQDLLPKQGILYFFYSAEQDAWGFDYQDNKKFKVLYYDGEVKDLKRLDFPDALDTDSIFDPCQISPQLEVSLPTRRTDELLPFLTTEEQESLFELINEYSLANRMLGHSDPIQGEMELECELVTNGLYCGDASGYEDPKAKELEHNAADWRLLLQVDSNEDCSMMWGDAGRLYFWIKEQDLREKNFDKCWFILQCY